ncbi:uncharacterized protein RSE6_03275 [Rhynchosporium secalis]|uniref:Uncharacterized protein n=1 Tax=Rhynchosporium secalis TaxID=38038 RepID=A0A1E1M2C5_RHYSE|nr:uncharacterized protein RSE6_03275 [Rhynchosporium secalis]
MATSQSSMEPMGGASQKAPMVASPCLAIDQYARRSQPTVTERIAHGSTAKERDERIAMTKKNVDKWGRVLGVKNIVAPVKDKMTDELKKM